MEEHAASAFIQVVIRNLINISGKEVLKKETSLLCGLETAQKFVNSLFQTNADVGDWLEKLGAVVLDAENVVDELKYHVLSKEIKNSKPDTSKTKLLTYFSPRIWFGRERTLALRINEINEGLEFLNHEAQRIGIDVYDGDVIIDEPYGSENTKSFSADRVFVGRDHDVLTLADMLITNTEQEEQVFSVLAIQGMGGIGKTTLARKLFNHENIKARFGESRIWVHVGQAFDPTVLLMKILATFTSDRVETRHGILQRLQQAFIGKTYLLVLDDVWNNDVSRWEDFLYSMTGVISTKGNNIIITTRSTRAAEIMTPFHIHQLKGLTVDECWSIIKTITYGNLDVPSGLVNTGREYARICKGLPLSANIVGGVFRGATEEYWMSMLEYRQDLEESIFDLLRWSFRELYSSLRTCSPYCSIFPQGCKIVKQELIELWMAEGFLQPERGYDMESVGDMFSNVLLHKSVLEVAERDENGNVESFVMHDLMHDLLSSISFPITKQVAKYKRTLFLEGEVSDNILDCPSLRNLSLTRVKELPNSIRKLIHLRNLNISKSWIRQLPDWIGELYNLQTLRADTKHLWKLPSTLKYLINLRHLYVLPRVKLPAEMGRLTNLRTLRHFAVGENKGAQIEELKSLNNLHGEIHISNLEKVKSKEEAVKANVHQKKNLSELVLIWSKERGGEGNDESVLEGLEPHPNLKKLRIVGFKGNTLPTWIGNLSSLSHLSLSSCSKLKHLSPLATLEHLTKLQHLDIKDCPHLQIGLELANTPHLTVNHIVDGDMSSASNEVLTESHGNTPHFSSKVEDDHRIKIKRYTNEIVDGDISYAANEVLTESHEITPHLTNKFDEHGIEPCTKEIVMSSAANEFLIKILRKTLMDEYSSIGDAQQLQTTLGTIQSYLNDAQNKSIGEEGVKFWLRELQDVAFKADNVLDKLKYHLLQNEVKKLKKPKAKDKLKSCFSCFDNIARQPNMAKMIKEINTEFDFMIERAEQLGVQSNIVEEPAAAAAGVSSDSFTSDPIFSGRDDDVKKLVEMLIAVPGKTTLSILAIVGASGVGKETLTRNVLNHEDIKVRFGCHVWVLVSRIFDPVMLFKKILSTLTSETKIGGTETEESILKQLQQALKTKTYILVLEDVWNEDVPKWKIFINSISRVTSTRGNAIIITTRNSEVASLVKPLYTYPLNGLLDEYCWSIIVAKSFQNGDVPSGHEVVEGKIAKGCQGLPLAANVLGGMLSYKSKEEWSFVENFLSDGKEAESISNILKLSFDRLPSSLLKMCFAYCSVFPKGWKIMKEELIELWMAEGFLQPYEGHDMESTGDMFSNVLLHNSLLQVAEKDAYGNVLSFVMHDLVHDLASAVLGFSDDTNQVLYLFHGKDHSSLIPKVAAKYLRTLIFQGEILDTAMFSSYESLHALSLDCGQVKELPSSIRELIHLRNLNVSRTGIEYLPEWISELHYLQTINASTESLRELPRTLKYLISLRHLYLCQDVKLPAEIGRLTNLQELKFRVGELKGYTIEELGSLNNLKRLCICNLEKVHDKEEAQLANISLKQNLSELSFEWDADIEDERDDDDEDVLGGLEPHPGLTMLKIAGYAGKKFPSWVQKMVVGDKSLIGLIEITLTGCKVCEEIPELGQLPNLKTLSLWRLSKVMSINASFYGNIEGVSFPALETLLLNSMEELKVIQDYWDKVEVFPRLVSLKIYWCNKLECLPSWLFVKARGLKELDIRHCSKLSRLPIPYEPGTLDSLESMTIKGCQNLKSIVNPESRGTFKSLRSIEIRDCQKLTEMVEPHAPLLKKVSMVELKSLQNLPKFLDSLEHSPSLAQLTIVGVPKFISGTKSWAFQKLRKLEIDVTVEWSSETSVAIHDTVDSMLRKCCSSIGELRLTGMEIRDVVPESIKHLTSLYNLELENSGVEKLPNWFQDLTYLKRLCLSNFPELDQLPSLKRLTELQEFHICNCPKIKIEYEGHKIFHRCAIYVNSHPL
ncbi:hypothetical protein AAHA92_04739 [Salvia divinorum]|uniref:Uncharacterized protein n=1 Tax=Salvia divinorum TaxID=28513 RepID=A0ABD1I079_SALDI